jgi:hypothetical protein
MRADGDDGDGQAGDPAGGAGEDDVEAGFAIKAFHYPNPTAMTRAARISRGLSGTANALPCVPGPAGDMLPFAGHGLGRVPGMSGEGVDGGAPLPTLRAPAP